MQNKASIKTEYFNGSHQINIVKLFTSYRAIGLHLYCLTDIEF